MKVARQTLSQLQALQRLAASAIMRPLDGEGRMQEVWIDGRRTEQVVAEIVKPNDRLSSFERLEIYNRQYWFRLIDSMHEDFPALRSLLGQGRFGRLIEAYLDACPSRSYTLRNLGRRLEQYIFEHPHLTHPRTEMAIELTRFEWAQIEAFDAAAHAPLGVDDLLGVDPEQLRLSLQPHIALLELNWALDEWKLAMKKRQVRSGASQAMAAGPRRRGAAVGLPRRKKVYVAVHRFENSLWYKRLPREAFGVLSRLREGQTLARACADLDRAHAPEVERWFANWMQMGWFCKRN